MSISETTRDGQRGVRPDRDALTGAATGRRKGRGWRGRGGGQPTVPDAEFTSYYGRPVINAPVWSSPDIPGYLFLGGLAGASSLLGAGAAATRRPALARVAKTGAFGAIMLSLAALIHDLGRPARFLHMLRVLKVSSPMNIGSWLLAGYAPLSGIAAGSALTRRLPRIGTAATAGSALLGPAVAAYTAALISDTAVPAWHDGHREMPLIFVGSGAAAAGGLGLLGAPTSQTVPARNLALFGVVLELVAFEGMQRRLGLVAEPYSQGRPGRLVMAGKVLSAVGTLGAVAGRRSRLLSALSGAALLAASAATRWGIFHAGMDSANDPKYTVLPQRERITDGSG